MARKSLILCDYCGSEAAEDQLHSIMIVKPGKKTGNKFEICPKCAEQIQTKLVSANKTIENPLPKKQTLEDMFGDDDEFIKQKKQERKTTDEDESLPEIVPIPDNKCRHLTKGRTTLGEIGGKKRFFQRCKDCKEAIPVEKAEKRRNFESLESDDDIRIKES